MKMLKPPSDFHAGKSSGPDFKKILKTLDYPKKRYGLDLSDVIFMDTYTFRLVFDYMSKFDKIIPPKSDHVVMVYDIWVDSKKGLKK